MYNQGVISKASSARTIYRMTSEQSSCGRHDGLPDLQSATPTLLLLPAIRTQMLESNLTERLLAAFLCYSPSLAFLFFASIIDFSLPAFPEFYAVSPNRADPYHASVQIYYWAPRDDYLV